MVRVTGAETEPLGAPLTDWSIFTGRKHTFKTFQMTIPKGPYGSIYLTIKSEGATKVHIRFTAHKSAAFIFHGQLCNETFNIYFTKIFLISLTYFS